MTHDFAPRRIGEILDDAIELVRRNSRTLGPVSAVVMLPVAAAYSVVASFYLRYFLEAIGASVRSVSSATTPPQTTTFVLILMLLMQALGLLYTAARALLEATVFSNSAELLERRRIPLKDALKRGFSSFLWVLLLQAVTGAISGAAALVMGLVAIVAGIALAALSPQALAVGLVGAYAIALLLAGVVWVMLSLGGPIVVIEGGLGNAMRRSFRLVRKHFWRVLMIVAGSALLVTQFESALAAPTIVREILTGAQSPAAVFAEIAWGWKVFDGLVQGVAISAVLPFAAAVTLLTYLDLRARDEGMDLVVRARKLLPQ